MGVAGGWTYSGDPAGSNRDAVRFLVGQTSSSDSFILYDTEVDFSIAEESNNYGAAALLAESLASKYSGALNKKKVGDLELEYSDRATEYRNKGKSLRALAAAKVGPYMGGQTVAEKNTDRNNTAMVQPAFSVGMMDQGFPSGSTST